MAFTERISAACGRKKAELVLKHAKIINVFTESPSRTAMWLWKTA